MHFIHIKDLVTNDPFPMYQTVSELIEADGEAEDLFLQNTVDNGYVEKIFFTPDDVSSEMIEIDITDYICDKKFELFESVIMNSDERENLSATKIESYYMACVKVKR